MESECPYCGNDRGNMYYCRHCSAPKGFIKKASIKLMEKVDLFETSDIKLALAKQAIEKKAENIIEHTVVAMDAAQETFAEYKKPTTRGRRSASPMQAFVGIALIMLVMMAVVGSGTLMRSVFTEPITPEDKIEPPIYVNVRVRIMNSTDYSFYKSYADFIGEDEKARCTFSYIWEQEYKLSRLFRAGERVSFCITKSDSMDEYFPYHFVIPMDWDVDSGVYCTTVVVD